MTAAPQLLAQLMALLAKQTQQQANYRETQYLAALTRPLSSEGTLIYRAPDYLEQREERPRREDMILSGGQLTLQMGRHRRTLALADYPQWAPVLDSLRATLAGDGAQLERLFQTQLSGTLQDWQLELQPRDATLAASVQSIRLQGGGAQIHGVEIRQRDGDRAVMQIEPSTW